MKLRDNLRDALSGIRLWGNPLLYQILTVYAAFWIVASVADKPWLANIVTVLALIAGAFLCFRYVPRSLSIILKGERGEYGAHNAVLGTAEVGVGLLWGGIYRVFYYNVFDDPQSWTGSGIAIFSLFLISKGVLRVAWSPSTLGEDYKLPENSLQVGSLILGVVIGAIIGKVLF